MRTLRWGASTVVIASLLAWSTHHAAWAGGELNFEPKPSAPAVAPARKAQSGSLLSNTWLGDLVERLIAGGPTPAAPRNRVTRLPQRQKSAPSVAATVAPSVPAIAAQPAATPPTPPTTTAQPSRPTQSTEPGSPQVQPPPAQKASALPSILSQPAGAAPITTGALPVPSVPDAPKIDPADPTAHVILEAERMQARLDLVKLELASRTYDEMRLAGQSAFDFRTDWRILERARDALSAAELAVADSSGFEANAYINEVDKIIVVAIAGTQDLKHGFLEESLWRALIQAQAPQQFFLAKSYTRSIIQRYQMKGFSTECVGHSLGGGACAYAASELGIRAIVINPISAGPLAQTARHLVTNYIVDGDIASIVYPKRGNEISGEVQYISTGSEAARRQVIERFGMLAGPILIVRSLRDSVRVHQIDKALDLLAAHAGSPRVR